MIRQLISVGLFAGIVFAGAGKASAQVGSTPPPVAVNEVAARADLAGNTIQMHLPLTVPAASELRITAETLSPAGTGSGQSTAEIKAGSREAVRSEAVRPRCARYVAAGGVPAAQRQ